MKLPTLYHKSKHGVLYSWNVYTEGSVIHSDTGQVGGQRVHSSKIAVPKNEGRANSTTAAEQAAKEAQAMWTFKINRKYSATLEEAVEVDNNQPMLALKFKDKKKKISYPVDGQEKINGCRVFARWENGRVVLGSRGNLEWTIPQHINRELEKYLPKLAKVDGELFYPGENLQTLISWSKKKRLQTDLLQLHVYDFPTDETGDDSLPWSQRKINLESWFTVVPEDSPIKLVETIPLANEQEVDAFFDRKTQEGCEGIMVRVRSAVYRFGYRSSELLKYKYEEDGEFLVTGVTTGVGKYANAAIFICETKEGKPFTVNMKCTQAQKEKYLRESSQFIGRMLTVSYANFTEEGKPFHGVGQAFRPVEDIG